jgi:hypothetical protein
MTTNITIPLIGFTVWAAFNATMFYCINSAVFAPNMGVSSDGETWHGKPSTLLTVHRVLFAAIFLTTSLLSSFDGAQIAFIPSAFSIVMLTDENPESDEPVTWNDVNNNLKLTLVAVAIGTATLLAVAMFGTVAGILGYIVGFAVLVAVKERFLQS